MFSPEEIAKLPKWAQLKANVLIRDLADAHKRIAAFNGETPTNIKAEGGLRSHAVYLPDDSTIKFTFPQTGGEIHLQFGLGQKAGTLNCFSRNSLIIRPGSSNYVQLADHRD